MRRFLELKIHAKMACTPVKKKLHRKSLCFVCRISTDSASRFCGHTSKPRNAWIPHRAHWIRPTRLRISPNREAASTEWQALRQSGRTAEKGTRIAPRPPLKTLQNWLTGGTEAKPTQILDQRKKSHRNTELERIWLAKFLSSLNQIANFLVLFESNWSWFQ